jgi:hypothetical protein
MQAKGVAMQKGGGGVQVPPSGSGIPPQHGKTHVSEFVSHEPAPHAVHTGAFGRLWRMVPMSPTAHSSFDEGAQMECRFSGVPLTLLDQALPANEWTIAPWSPTAHTSWLGGMTVTERRSELTPVGVPFQLPPMVLKTPPSAVVTQVSWKLETPLDSVVGASDGAAWAQYVAAPTVWISHGPGDTATAPDDDAATPING